MVYRVSFRTGRNTLKNPVSKKKKEKKKKKERGKKEKASTVSTEVPCFQMCLARTVEDS